MSFQVVRTAPNGEDQILQTLPDADEAVAQMAAAAVREAMERLLRAGVDPMTTPFEEREMVVQHCALNSKTMAIWNTRGVVRDYMVIHSLADLADADELVVYRIQPTGAAA